jgi:NitT/TauT family transport system substrate-binding protein
VIVGLVLLALLAGALPAGAPAQPRQLEKITLRLDWVNTGNHSVWYYARDKGIFAEQGLDIEILEGRGSDLTAQTVGNGSVMFGTADTATVISLASQGLPVKIVGIWFKTSPIALSIPRRPAGRR